jgi:hypothetical protein
MAGMTDDDRLPSLQGIHHLKVPVSDLDASLTFPGLGTALELRLDPERAERHRLFDPVTIAVSDRATLGAWDEYLTAKAILHSEVITAIAAWLIVVQDPDGNRLRLYTLETHGPELKPDEDNPWIRS